VYREDVVLDLDDKDVLNTHAVACATCDAREVAAFLEFCRTRAHRVLTEHLDAVDRVATALDVRRS
jgi:hypothetical protein